MQVLCGLQVLFLLFNCQTPEPGGSGYPDQRRRRLRVDRPSPAGSCLDRNFEAYYNPVFDSCWKQKSLYPLYLLGYSDFYCCFEL